MPAEEFALKGWAVPEGLRDLRALVELADAAHPQIRSEAFLELETAAIEVAGNVVEHGRPPGQIRWSFTLRVMPEHVECVLADNGQKYEGDLTAVMPDPLAESGRGLALARAVLDEFSHTHTGDENVWTMRRGV